MTDIDPKLAAIVDQFAIDGDVAGTDEGGDETATDGIYGLYQGTIGSRYKFYVDGKTTTYEAAGDGQDNGSAGSGAGTPSGAL